MNLLLVEDEPYTREGILSAIDWDALGITKVLTAEDGKKGIEMARKYSPEIILTDMYMPRMDGASMARSIREILPNSVFIFMSGYSDIAYYKSAVQVSALEFVVKPLVIDELVKILKKSVNHVLENRDKSKYYHIHKSNELARYVIRENIVHSHLTDLWTSYGMPYDEKYEFHTLILKRVHSENVFADINELAKMSSISVAAGSINIGYVIHAAVPLSNKALLDKFSQLLLNKYKNSNSYIAIGKPVRHPYELKDSYASAGSLIKLSFFYSERQIFTYKEKFSSFLNEYDCDDEISRLLCCNPEKAKQLAESYFEKIRSYAGTPIELVKYWGFRICAELYFHFDGMKAHDRNLIPDGENELWDKISSLNTLDALKNLVLETIDKLECSHSSDENSPIIWKVKRYIFNNISKPISLKSLSEHVNFSATYLCSLFKEYTGQTINSYILDLRIRRAKLMLESSSMNINEIADSLGFSSSSYFIKTFRKIIGITPQEYRKGHKLI